MVTEAVQQQRVEFWQQVQSIDPANLVFLDEMGVAAGIMREHGRSPKGERLHDTTPFYRGKRVTVVGAMSQRAILGMKTLNQALTGKTFEEFLKEELVPNLWEGAVLVMDNLRVHKVKTIAPLIEKAGASILYLPPYSPDFNPIEHWWWELKAFVRSYHPKNIEAVKGLLTIGRLLASETTLRNYCAHCCYCNE